MGSVSVLLDTHALLWWWSHPDRLTDRARDLIADPYSAVCVSAASASEISTKHRIGTLPSGGAIIDTWDERLSRDRFSEIA
ncbi:MAG: type II toxin-antitoxin system VapC family toxin, partial [Spirochaetota bacterium]